ncbi:MAG: hypothetical protein WCI05_17430 [Myxococcales bacterium]|jgi:uncharacterized protein (TIGR02722 family)
MHRFIARSVPLALVLAMWSCSKQYVRGSQDPSVDTAAMSTGLDKDDIQQVLNTTLNDLRKRPIMDQWRAEAGAGKRPVVAIAPFINATSEHIDSMLDAMLSETETWLVNSQVVDVVARDRQLQMIREVEGSQHPVFNPLSIPKYGRQFGVKYFVTGKVSAGDERTDKSRRVQYLLFMQIIEVETSLVKWQQKGEVTKAVR